MDSSRINYKTPIFIDDGNIKMFAFEDDAMHTHYLENQKVKDKIKNLNIEVDDYEWYNGISTPTGNKKILNDLKLELYKEKLLEVVSQFDKKYYDKVLEALMIHLGTTGIATIHIIEFKEAPIILTTKGILTLPSWIIQIHTEMSLETAFIYEGMDEAQNEGTISHQFGYLTRDFADVIEGLTKQEPCYILDIISTYLLLTAKENTLEYIDEFHFRENGKASIKYAKEHFSNLLDKTNPYKIK